ncbi:MAG: 30S ribosomal protein S4 [Candidatus Marinimicrobia bacterium]|nr:30S ribosomal protein S4 [Candidatus Neomarinimicrobiota bacterium]|tara:strand:+ start:27960 stop:28571 length:612 start_codon:yes stop_codon:yes gene_type:complete
MARYRGPRARICRRLEFPVFESDKFSSIRKNYPPGQHGQSRRRKLSNYGVQLREKQRIKYLYGILEKQFRNYFKKANNKSGATGDNLLISLESRLDNTVYRLGLANTRSAARQLVSHKHFLVNNKVVNIPSYSLSDGDVIEVRSKSKKNDIFLNSMRRIKSDNPMPWLTLDKSKLIGTFDKVPTRDEISEPLNEQLVVELYSK